MAITDPIKYIRLQIKHLSEYVKIMLTSDSIIMTDGKDLQTEINELNGNLATMSNKINNNLENLSNTIQVAQTGNYGKEWAVSTVDYWEIGNTFPAVNSAYFSITSGKSSITVKKAGIYLIFASAGCRATSSSNAIIWGKITKNSASIRSGQSYGYGGYFSLQLMTCARLNAGDSINFLLSASISSGTLYATGGESLQVIRIA